MLIRTNNNDYKNFENVFGLSSSRKYVNKKIIFVLTILAIAVLLIFAFLAFKDQWFDLSAKNGSYEGKSEQQIKNDLNAQVSEGEMNVSIANTIKFHNGSTNEGIAHIENIAANKLDQKVYITLADSEEVLYESGAIAPNHCINTIKLNKELSAGQYKANAIFKGYDPQSHEEKGVIAAQINILVE